MSVDRFWGNLQGLRNRVREDGMGLDMRHLMKYAVDVIDFSPSEIKELQLKVKMLEQKPQAIDNVLKGGSV